MGVRKNILSMTSAEKQNFLHALLTLKSTIANPTDPVAKQISIYDQFAAIHLCVQSVSSPFGTNVNTGHLNAGFCPWHREFLRRFELALQSVDPTVNLPYWDWTDHAGSQTILFKKNLLGPSGSGGPGGTQVMTGFFAASPPSPLPPWWPPGFGGWHIRASLDQGHSSALALTRSFGSFSATGTRLLATKAEVLVTLSTPTVGGLAPDQQYADSVNGFEHQLEFGVHMHNNTHKWIGGHMSDTMASANDPIFWLHHCNIDRLWAMWQINGHPGSAYYPASGAPYGHNLNDAMWPWIGTMPGFSSGNLPGDIVLPDFSTEAVRRPIDTLNHRAMGYSYDTEVILGIALDQAATMTGLTPDPMVVAAPPVTKWQAATRGVSAVLHDCESAFANGEAYITAGIETFRYQTTNLFARIFTGAHYGLIKNGTNYSQLTFDTLIATQSPAGNSSLADAITDTENNLVRPPFGNLPANDNRYMFVLTDGKGTAGNPLSSIPAKHFANTIIFAMGFGNAEDVNYTKISATVSKGKAAPSGVDQVYHGENAGTIDKFFANSIAHVIGYTPVTDPVFELYPGEHVEIPFDVSQLDESFMITCQGFDYIDENWSFCLVLPSGYTCSCNGTCATDGHDHGGSDDHRDDGDKEFLYTSGTISIHEHEQMLVTSNKSNGRSTIFLQRNGAADEDWVGHWSVRAMYKMNQAENMGMLMPTIYDLIKPVGALPIRGPVFAKLVQPFKQIQSSRFYPLNSNFTDFYPVEGISVAEPQDPVTLTVNIYGKQTITANVSLAIKAPFAGNDFEVTVNLEDPVGGAFSNVRVLGRLVAPNFSVGKILADTEIIAPISRTKYIHNKNGYFDVALYLAEYEQKKPGSFPVRDRLIEFKGEGTKFGTVVTKNDYPGIYYMGLLIEGLVERPDGGTEYFRRIVSTHTALNVLPDEKASKPEISIARENVLSVKFTPTDKLGNILLPVDVNMQLFINDHPVSSNLINDYTGNYLIEATFASINPSVLEPSRKEKQPVSGFAFTTTNDEKLELKTGAKIKLSVQINEHYLILHPAFVLK